MNSSIIRLVVLLLFPNFLFAQVFQVKGTIRDIETHKPIVGVNIKDALSDKGTASNELGCFELDLPAKKYILIISSLGYQTQEVHVQINETINIFLEPDTIQLLTAIITASNKENEEQLSLPGKIQLSIDNINKLPSIGGERDPIKAFSLLTGITKGREGQASLLIRGGERDQTVFLLDGTPVYNVGHYLDLLSVFNPDAIKSIDLFKGNFPSQYGGGLSGVLNIKSKDGAIDKWKGKVNLGMISSKIVLEGSLGKKQKTSFLMTGRASYLDIFNLGKKEKVLRYYDGQYNGFRFFDSYAKITHKVNKRHLFYVGMLYSIDQLEQIEGYGGNGFFDSNKENLKTFNVSANYIWKPHKKISTQIKAFFSSSQSEYSNQNYFFELYNEYPGYIPPVIKDTLFFDRYKSETSLSNVGLKINIEYNPVAKHKWRTGLQISHYTYNILKRSLSSGYLNLPSFIENIHLPVENACEISFYLEDNWRINEYLNISIGSRLELYSISNYRSINHAPHLSAIYQLPSSLSFKAGYNRTYQYNRLLLRNGMSLYGESPTWIPSSQSAPPSYVDQFGIEITRKLPLLFAKIKLEGYYKKMYQLIERGSDLAVENSWEEAIYTNGRGKSYGIEFSISRELEKWNTYFGYTLSWAERQFSALNNNIPYPFRFDNRHVLNLSFGYDINEFWKAGASWTYQSGDHFSFPVSKTISNPLIDSYFVYSGRNGFQLPAYHRLDLTIEYQKKLKKGRYFGIRFDVYNAYFRLNPYYLRIRTKTTFDQVGNPLGERTEVKLVSLFPILPTVNLVYKFK